MTSKIKSEMAIRIAFYAFAFATVMATELSRAESEPGFTLSPMVGKYFPAGNRNLDNGDLLSLGLGYEFNEHWGIEASYLTGDADSENTNIEVDIDAIRLDALYYFNQERLRPYLVFGAGDGEFSTDFAEEDDTFANLGVGFTYAINRAFALRSDVRLMHGMDSGESDYVAAVGALFKFGAGSKSSKRKPAATAPVEQAPSDRDNDGVIDSEDRCPDSPLGAKVDSEGCDWVRDSDGDGVADSRDKCPDTSAGAKVDETGCYIVLKEEVSVSLNVNFATNSDRVIENSVADIQELADFLRTYAATDVVIEGHTDSVGAAEYNKTLSQKRADAVAKILTERFGIAASRVRAVGFGEEQPLVDNDTADNRAKNRRVTAVVSATVEKVSK